MSLDLKDLVNATYRKFIAKNKQKKICYPQGGTQKGKTHKNYSFQGSILYQVGGESEAIIMGILKVFIEIGQLITNLYSSVSCNS